MTVITKQLGDSQVTIHAVRTADQATLALTRLETPTIASSRTPVVLAHGTFSNRTIWISSNGKGFAPYLAAAGYDCWVLEVRGHGQARRRRMKPYATSFDTLIDYDVAAALDYVYQQTDRRVFWVGHSAGGVLIYGHLARYPEAASKLRGIVSFGSQANHTARTFRGKVVVYFTLAVNRLCGYFPARLLRLGPEDEFGGVLDQWAHWNLGRQWNSLDGHDYQSGLVRVPVPVLALAGGGDHFLAPESGCRALFNALGSSDKQFMVCSQANGHAEDYDHLSLVVSKNAQKEIWPAVKTWLTQRE